MRPNEGEWDWGVEARQLKDNCLCGGWKGKRWVEGKEVGGRDRGGWTRK